MAEKRKIDVDIEAEATKIVSDLWINNQEAIAFVTDRVAFQMKNLIRDLRKNYWGIFDDPIDPVTGRKKIWIPATEAAVESVVKSIDLDTKDINFKAKKPESIALTGLVRAGTKNALDKTNFNGLKFGELLDMSLRDVAIDGTFIWKTTETKVKGKPTLNVRLVNLLNFAIDPTADNIQDAEGVVERAVVTKSEFNRMNVPLNADKPAITTMPSRNDDEIANYTTQTGIEYVTLYEYWGLFPKSLITGRSKDAKELVFGRILTSGGSTGNSFILHDIVQEKKELKPYEECWYKKINGRWYGRGIAEKVMFLQLWLNTIVNIRINRNHLSQLGLFKLRKGSGVSQQKISKLGTNGIIVLNNVDDLQQMVMQDASPSSYQDENIVNGWIQKITGTYEAITGEQLPSSTPATTTVIQNRNAQGEFVLIKEDVGLFLERWAERHALPIIGKRLKKDEVIRITENPEERKARDERIVNELAYRKLEEIKESGKVVDENKVLAEIERMKASLESMGEARFSNLLEDIDFSEYDVDVQITNEDMDKAVVAQNLISLLQTIIQVPTLGVDPADIVRQIFDLMGLTPPKSQTKLQTQEQIGTMMGGIPGMPGMSNPQMPQMNEQQITTEANII